MYIIKNLYIKEILKDIKNEQDIIINNLEEIRNFVKIFKKENGLEENFNKILKSCSNIKNIISINDLENNNRNKITDKIDDVKISEHIDFNEIDNLLKSINFDSTNFDTSSLCYLTLEIFKKTFDFNFIKIKEEKLKLFIFEVSKYYKNNPFHNFEHAVSVLQFTYLIISNIKISDYVSIHRLFGLMIATLVHDIDHPGHTNLFEIKKKSELSQIYNDNSVLENHHCSTAFYILGLPQIQLLENFSIEEFKIVRETIIESIISTDMKYHFELINTLENNKNNLIDKQNEILFCKLIIHVADLSNQLRNFKIAYYMCQGLRKEFMKQAENEKKLNLSSQSHMENIKNDDEFYKCEIEFCTSIIKPLIKNFCQHFPIFNYVLKNLNVNINKWKKLLMYKIIKEELFLDNENYNDDNTFNEN